MKDVLLRLRSALTPQAVSLLALVLLGLMLLGGGQESSGSDLERRIARTLSSVKGAGKVEVVIRTREVVTLDGVFSAKPAKYEACGAVAVAQGADDPLVALELQQALCALLGLPASSVSVVAGGMR